MSAPVTTKELATLIPASTDSVCDRLEKATKYSAAMVSLFEYMLSGTNPSNNFLYDICSQPCETTSTTSTSSTTTTSTSSTTTTTAFGCNFTPDLIPTMTSNTSPSGVASASPNNADAFRAFDNSLATFWGWSAPVSGSPYIAYQFPGGYQVTKYRVNFLSLIEEGTVLVMFLEGSNDGSSWTTLDTQTVPLPTADVTYTFSNVVNFTHYRLRFFPVASEPFYFRVYALELFACVDTTTTTTTTTSTTTTTTTTAP